MKVEIARNSLALETTEPQWLGNQALNLYGSQTRSETMLIEERAGVLATYPNPHDECFISSCARKVFSLMNGVIESVSGWYLSKETSSTIIYSSTSTSTSQITQVFQHQVKPSFEISIGQPKTILSEMRRLQIYNLSLRLGGETINNEGILLDLIPRDLDENDIGNSLKISIVDEQKRRYLSALPKTIQEAIISLLVKGRPTEHYDCFQFVNDCIGNSRVESRYELVPFNNLDKTLLPGDLVFMGKNDEIFHGAVYLGDNFFLSVLGTGNGLSVVAFDELMREYGADSIYKIHLTSYVSDLPKLPPKGAVRFVVEAEDGLTTSFFQGGSFKFFAQRVISREVPERKGYLIEANQFQDYQEIEIYLHNIQGYLPITIHPSCQKSLLELLNDSPLNLKRFFQCIASIHQNPLEIPAAIMRNVRHYHSMGDLISINDGNDVVAFALYLFDGLVLYENFVEGEFKPLLLVTTIDDLLRLKKGTGYSSYRSS